MGSIIGYFFGSNDVEESKPKRRFGLTVAEEKFVQEFWKIVDRDALKIGVEIMTEFFREYSEYQDEFPNFRGKELYELADDPKFHVHCLTIMSTISQAVEFIHDSTLLTAGLEMVAERHARRGQDSLAFELLHPVLIDILERRFRSKCTPRVWEAVDMAIGVIFKEIEYSIDMYKYGDKKGITN